jgi:hypothetical protein
MNPASQKILGIVAAPFLCVLSLVFFAIAYVLFTHMTKFGDFINAVFATAIAILYLPIFNLIDAKIRAKQPAKAKELKIARIAVVSFRIFLVVLISIIIIPNWSKVYRAIQAINPTPVAETRMVEFEGIIKMGNIAAADSAVRTVPNFSKRVNINRLVALAFTSCHARAEGLFAQGNAKDAVKQIRLAFAFLDGVSLIKDVAPGQYPKTGLSTYLKASELCKVLADFSKYCGASGDCPDASAVSQLIKTIDPANPVALLATAEEQWVSGDARKAIQMYSEYAKKMTESGDAAGISGRVKSLIAVKNSLDKSSLANLYGWWLEVASPDNFATADSQEFLIIAGGKRGPFYNDIGQILWPVNGLVHFAWVFAKEGTPDSSAAAFEQISGIKAYTNDGKSTGFRYVNPGIVKWGYENLIPDPKSIILTYPAQLIYDRCFRNLFRVKAFAYRYLTAGADFKKEVDYFRVRMMEKDFDGVSFLTGKYGIIHPGDDVLDNPHERVTASIGFWLRRGIDGSDKELWAGLSILLKQYDKKWFDNLTAGNIGWSVWEAAPEEE